MLWFRTQCHNPTPSLSRSQVRNHPCETSGSGATFTTTFDRQWAGNKMRRHWNARNRESAKKSKLELMPCARHMRTEKRPPVDKCFFYAFPGLHDRMAAGMSEMDKGIIRTLDPNMRPKTAPTRSPATALRDHIYEDHDTHRPQGEDHILVMANSVIH